VPFHATLSNRLTREYPIRQVERDAHYAATYDLFLRFFKERIAIENLRADDAKVGVVLVYSWMAPAELKTESWKHFAAARRILQLDKARRLNAAEIDTLKAFVGGSLIATSKYLHFLNPRRYAIWDTNVARAAYRYSWQQCNRSERYLEYLDDMKHLTLPEALRQRVRTAIGTSSSMRCKEFALFHLGLAESAPPTTAPALNIADITVEQENYTLDLGISDDE
jgi:hypothetical protein